MFASTSQKTSLTPQPWTEIFYIAADFIPAYMFASISVVSHDLREAITRYAKDKKMLVMRPIYDDSPNALIFCGYRAGMKDDHADSGTCPMTGTTYRAVYCEAVSEMYKTGMVMTFVHTRSGPIGRAISIDGTEEHPDIPWAGYGEAMCGKHDNIREGDKWHVTCVTPSVTPGKARKAVNIVLVGRCPGYAKSFYSHERHTIEKTRKIFIAHGETYILAESISTDLFEDDNDDDDINNYKWDIDDRVNIIYPLRSDVIATWPKK